MTVKTITISKNRTISVDGIFDKQTKYVKIGVTMSGDVDEVELGVKGEVMDEFRKLSALVDEGIKEEVKKYKGR